MPMPNPSRPSPCRIIQLPCSSCYRHAAFGWLFRPISPYTVELCRFELEMPGHGPAEEEPSTRLSPGCFTAVVRSTLTQTRGIPATVTFGTRNHRRHNDVQDVRQRARPLRATRHSDTLSVYARWPARSARSRPRPVPYLAQLYRPKDLGNGAGLNACR